MFTVAGLTSTEVAVALAEREIAVWDGTNYAWELRELLGLRDGAVRAGFVHYNDDEDAERLVAAVADVAAGAGPHAPAAASGQDPPA
jgi:selenocysteine lyase/cysteine desulfurase